MAVAETVAVVTSIFGFLTVVVTLLSPCISEPLSEQCKIFRKRKEHLETLKTEVNILEQLRGEVERQFKQKVVRKSLRKCDWLQKADEFINGFDPQLEAVRISKNCCGLPYYRSQYKAGKDIAARIKQVNVLKSEITKLINVEESKVVGHMIGSGTKLLGEAARNMVEEIKEYVTGEEVGTIRVYGMAGSGKTAVVSEVNDLILNDGRICAPEGTNTGSRYAEDQFDKVIWVTVENQGSIQSSIDNLQNKIAEKLQIDLNKATGSRADTLETALKELRFLIILDDMWKKLSLELIGIPVPTRENGCKVIIVSRSLPVFSDIKIDKKVEIKPLSDTAARELFEREASIRFSDLRDDTQTMAEKMVDDCDGLPLAIGLLAQTLKELKSDGAESFDAAWNAALLRLQSSHLESMNEKAFARLKYSYDMLKKDAQQCLLYCALYPCGHYIGKKELVEYWFWEGLSDRNKRDGRIEDMVQAREILDELVGAYLLETVSQEGGKECIKMRRLVQHMAVHITKESPQFFTKAGHQKEKFLGDWLHNVERASLMMNQFKFLGGEPKCPKLTTLLLQHNPIGLNLHENFFRSMPNLQVLDLSHTDITSLPQSSFSRLTKLSALLLHHCRKLKFLPSLEKCKKLLVLDLSDTPIAELPKGVKKLTKLLRLNLSRTNVKIFEANLVPVLVHLEELLMITNESGFLWGSTKGASIDELISLQNLAILHVNFLNAASLDMYVDKHHCPPCFKFCVGGASAKNLPENSIVFKGNFLVNGGDPVSLPEHISELHVMSNDDLLCLQVNCHLKKLKVINIHDCRSLVYLFTTDMLGNLPNLEMVFVEKCQKMVGLIEPEESDMIKPHLKLKHLQIIRISDCENLVYLLRSEMLHYFPELLEISIKRCQRMEVVIESQEPNVCPDILPKLQELVLHDLQELHSIYNGEMKCNFRQNLWNCPALKMPMITSLPAELLPCTTSVGGSNQLQRSYSFDDKGALLPEPIDIKTAEVTESVRPKRRNAARDRNIYR